MPGDLQIHLHCLCWNEVRLLPDFFRCYDRWVDEYHVWDNGSTDGSLEFLKSHPRVRVHHYEVDGDSSVDSERQMFDRIWQESRGLADWVILVNIDEHLHHPDLVGYLRACASEGFTAIRAIGYEMVSDRFPEPDGDKLLCERATEGVRSSKLDRLAILSPVALTATRFSPGLQQSSPQGHVAWPLSPEVLLLRYRILGDDYYLTRIFELAGALRAGDHRNAWAGELVWTPDQLMAHAAELRARRLTVPGLGEFADLAPVAWRGDEKVVDESGLLDVDWYMTSYPDVKAQNIDPLTHFCFHGWKEGRQPNPYFDVSWYSRTYSTELRTDENPLVHFIRSGEKENVWPSPHFDPEWYRDEHQIPADESPLRHFLLRRHFGAVSPVPSFDREGYLRAHPDLATSPQDYYLHALKSGERASRAKAGPPDMAEILALCGGNLTAGVWPAQVGWDRVLEVLRRFLPWMPFDEQWYLETYPDVAAAVSAGAMASGRNHFRDHGFYEGRRGTRPDGESEAAV